MEVCQERDMGRARTKRQTWQTREGQGKGGKKGMMMKMLSKAHCQNANQEDETKQESATRALRTP